MTALASAAKRAKMEQSDWSITINTIVLQILAAFCPFFLSPVAVSKKAGEILCMKKLMFWLEKMCFLRKSELFYRNSRERILYEAVYRRLKYVFGCHGPNPIDKIESK